MPDSPSKPVAQPDAASSTSYKDRREVPRHTLIASAEEIDLATGTRLKGRVSELSLKGGYLDTLNPFPKDTRIRVVITHHGTTFTALARVIYTQLNMGMGITFTTVEPDQLEILQKWLAEMAG